MEISIKSQHGKPPVSHGITILSRQEAFLLATWRRKMDKTCPICNTSFYVRPSHYDKRVTCSKGCQGIFFSTSFRGEGNPHWQGGTIQKKCQYCGITIGACKAIAKTQKFCSTSCKAKSEQQGINKICIICGKNFYVRPSLSKRNICSKECRIRYCSVCNINKAKKGKPYCRECSPRKLTTPIKLQCYVCGIDLHRYKNRQGAISYCSPPCRAKARIGEHNPNWKGGILPITKQVRASHQYAEWRNSIFTRDHWTCTICGRIGNELHAHHIITFSTLMTNYNEITYEKIIENPRLWDISNGTTLCRKCHRSLNEVKSTIERLKD